MALRDTPVISTIFRYMSHSITVLLGVKSHHFLLPDLCISMVVVLGMFPYGSLYTFKNWISKDFRSGGSWSHLFE